MATLSTVRFSSKTEAVMDSDCNIYSLFRLGKRRSGAPFWKVTGYSRIAGRHSDLERQYSDKESAMAAALSIAERELTAKEN